MMIAITKIAAAASIPSPGRLLVRATVATPLLGDEGEFAHDGGKGVSSSRR